MIYVTDNQLAARFGVQRATIWRWAKQERDAFPAPIKLGPNVTRWRLADVEAWEAERAAGAGAA